MNVLDAALRAPLQGWRAAYAAYCLLFLALTSPYWGLGDVVMPYVPYSEISAAAPAAGVVRENRKFGDFVIGYVPEVAQHLRQRGNRPALWSRHNEVGRPLYHTSGFGSAFPLSWLVSKYVQEPFGFLTVIALGTCFLAGLFMMLLCGELGLSAGAALVAGCTLAVSPVLVYWLSFPMFAASFCWSAAVLGAMARLARRPNLLGFALLAVSLHSLLMTGYPQIIVFHGYLFAGFGVVLLRRVGSGRGWRGVRGVLFAWGGAGALGGLLAAPVYLDVAKAALHSARLAAAPSFFSDVLPRIDSMAGALRFFVLATAPELFGNPMNAGYPFGYYGLSVSVLTVFVAVVAVISRWPRVWGWVLAIGVAAALTLLSPLYEFAVRHLGFGLSRSSPLGAALLPLCVLAGFGADVLLRSDAVGRVRRSIAVAAGALACAGVVVLGFVLAVAEDVPVAVPTVLILVFAIAAFPLFRTRPRPVLLLALVVVWGAAFSFPLLLRQDPGVLVSDSPLLAQMRSVLPERARFASVDPTLGVLPPNLNAYFELPSIHTYNSLSSDRYRALLKELGGETKTYGRWNDSIAPDYGSVWFWMSNVALILSRERVDDPLLEYVGEQSGVHLHRVRARMGFARRIPLAADEAADAFIDPRERAGTEPRLVADEGATLRFEVDPGGRSLVMLSQAFHEDWKAEVLGPRGWESATTIAVNGVFQGVVVPAAASQLRLAFEPAARFAPLSRYVWAALLLAALVEMLWARFRSGTRQTAAEVT